MTTDTPAAAAITAEREALAARLRSVVESVRRKPMPLSDFIPLLQQAADALSAPVAAQPADSTEQALGLYVAQADDIRDLLDRLAPHTSGNLQTRIEQALIAQPADSAMEVLRKGVRQLTSALQEREWADLLTTDEDLAALEDEVRKLVERAQ